LTKPDNYLKRYADKYRVSKGEDGIWQIQTTHKARDGLTFDVYDYSDTLLAVLLPPVAARHLLKRRPGIFTIHQDAGDGTVLLFEEEMLEELADDLKLRKKRKGRKMSKEEIQKLIDAGRRFQFTTGLESEKTV